MYPRGSDPCLLRLAEEGLSFAQIREEYPELADADIQAAIQYPRLTVEDDVATLHEQQAEAANFDAVIAKNLKDLGYGV